MDKIKIIAGLGNPGESYSRTRHNVGFIVIDKIAANYSASLRKSKKFNAMVGKVDNGSLILIKPLTYMNLSGFAVSSAMHYFKIDVSELLVISDDLDIPVGKMRFQDGGGSAGHKGVESVIFQLNNREFIRLRVGIGRNNMDVISYVLNGFNIAESAIINNVIEEAAPAAIFCAKHGVSEAANRYNGKLFK